MRESATVSTWTPHSIAALMRPESLLAPDASSQLDPRPAASHTDGLNVRPSRPPVAVGAERMLAVRCEQKPAYHLWLEPRLPLSERA